MITDTTIPAPVSVLFFLGAIGGTFAAAIAVGVLLFLRRRRIALLAAGVWATAAVFYLGALIGFSMLSRTKVLAAGAEKHFCEIDCHIANSIVGVRRVDAEHVEVAVRTRFDETTISPTRGDGLLTPSPHVVVLADRDGEHHGVVMEAANAGERDPATPLRPGESYVTRYLFSSRQPIEEARVFLGNRGLPEALLIGNEGSWGHKKVWFRLS